MEKVTLRRLIILLYICAYSLSLNAQKNHKNTSTSKISCPEKRWAIFHPFIAKKSYSLTKEALHITDSIKNTNCLDGDISGGQVDAFKHAYWMALLAQHIKYRKALKLGKAHEKGNHKSFKKNIKKGIQTSHDQKSSEMDLWNNEKGIEIGQEFKGNNLIIIQETIIDSILSGKMKIIRKNSSGQYLDCEGNVIPKDHLVGKWENEKCLVNSNQIDN